MNFRHSKNLLQGGDGIQKIYSSSWSSNNMRLAVAQADRRISLFDENGEKRETFSTKPGGASKNYVIRELAFSPDSTKLAVAQSDNIIFVYKLGLSWGEKKSICNKLEQTAPVTCMTWSRQKNNDIYFGLADGKVKTGLLNKNQTSALYSTDSYVVSLAVSHDGKFLISGHVDCMIQKLNLENSNVQKLVMHSSIPYCLAWGNAGTLLAAGNDYKVLFYNDIGKKLQQFDYSQDEKLKEFSSCRVSPSGDAIAVGNFNKFFVYLYNGRKQIWEESCIKYVDGLYSVSSLCWKPDGSALVTGNLLGSVDLFEASLKKTIFKDIFEITYVSHSQVVIKNLETQKRLVIKPQMSIEITKINIYLDNFLVMFTKESIIVGDLNLEKHSEIQWKRSTQEKFDFSNLNVCMIFNQDDLALIEYGSNDILGYCRTEYIHSNLISVRLNYNNMQLGSKSSNLKIIAYLIDLNTIYIQDLVAQQNIATISHENKIDFLELNKNGNKLIFRDRKRHLYLYYVFEKRKVTLLNFCGYVQWVPNSEVLVAQERKNVCVWYNVDDPDKVKIIPVKGEVEEIRRREGKTEVIVEESMGGGGNYGNTQTYLLDDGLIAFSTAVDENDLNKAVKILENLEMNTETETHWKTLAKLAIANKSIIIAQRCYAAIGSYSKANYIKKVMKIVEKQGLTVDHPLVEARLLILDKQFNNAENLLLSHNLLDETIEILNELQKWDESVKIAEKYNYKEIAGIKSEYYSWLLSNDQLDKAAVLKEQEGDFLGAIELYIQGGYPAKAANLVKTYDQGKFDNNTLERIIKNLLQVGIFEKAGELLEHMGHYQRSLDAYKEAKCYSKAVEIAKKYIPSRVERLEEEWGEDLFQQKQFEGAIIHFIEAGSKERAVEAAIQARKWEKAIELVNNYTDINMSYYIEIGKHFENQRKLDQAERYYLKAGNPSAAFTMYVNAGRWDKAESIIKKYMKDEESSKLIISEAMRYEKEMKTKEAEKLYIIGGEPDMAINMYKQIKQYDQMIRLVSQHRADFLKKTHQMIAALLEADKNLKQAEYHYIQAGNWKGCVLMYRSHSMWEDSLRVAKANGSKGELNELAKGWVNGLPKDQQIQKLISMGLAEAAIDICLDNKDFSTAFKLAEQYEKYKKPEIHLKYAYELENEQRFHDAEEHYIKSNNVQEAIQMYEHIGDFQSALRIARQHDPASVFSIYFNQGKIFMERGDLAKAEMCFVNAKQPEYMVKVYTNEKNYKSALAFASKYCPQMENDLRAMVIFDTTTDNMSGDNLLENGKLFEDSKDYKRAIDTYLEVSEKHFTDPNKLEEVWNKAVSLAMEYDKGRAADIAFSVAMKLKKVKKFQEAAGIFENIGQLEEAIACHCERNNFDRAKMLVKSMKLSDMKDKLAAMVERREKEYLVKMGNVEGLIDQKDEEGLKILIEKGEFKKCMEYASELSPEIFNKYLIFIVKKYLGDKNLAGTADFLEEFKTPIYEYNLELYKEIALEILAEENLEELRALKDMLLCVVKQLTSYEEFKPQFKNISRLYKIAYFQFLKFTMKSRKENFPKSYYRICLSVLSFGDIIKFDLALLDAGLICRDLGLKSNAFILLNRYLDLFEVIEEPQIKLEEENEFKDTEFPQLEPFRSEVNIITADKREEIHQWIISAGVDKNFTKSLIRKPCPKCGKNIFEGTPVCKYCNYTFECCIISGFPIHQGVESVICTSCGKKAIKECWKEWITTFQQCPNCKSVQMSYK